jgi:hypothetical protein
MAPLAPSVGTRASAAVPKSRVIAVCVSVATKQLGGGLDVDLPTDLDYQWGTGPDGHAQIRRLGAVRDSRSRLPPGIGAGHDPQ